MNKTDIKIYIVGMSGFSVITDQETPYVTG